MVRVSDFIAKYLKDRGVQHVFMVTGGGSMYLNDSFGNISQTICFHHEQACAIAAESYARLTGRIPVINVTSGPGGTNAITGVLGAWTDSMPMLVISGQVRFDTTVKSSGLKLRQLGDQEAEIVRIVSPITKYAAMITDPYTIKYHLDKALYLAFAGRPGPCWLDIPLDVQQAQIEEEKLIQYDSREDVDQIPPKISTKLIKSVVHHIKKAKRPVILAGPAIRSSGALDAFKLLIDKLNIPILTAFNAHDCIESKHPLYVGRPGTIGERAGNFILQNSDFLLVLGCRLDIRQIGYAWKSFAKNAFKVVVDIDEEELKKPTIFPDLTIHGNVKDFIEHMLVELGNNILDMPFEWMHWCKERIARYPVVLPEHRCGPQVNPYGFVEELGKQLQKGQIIVLGNATACIVPFQILPIKQNQRIYSNSGAAAMGYDLPAAIGAHISSGKKIVCLAGDGSIQMNIQELQTIRHHNFPIKIFVLNNNGYHSVRQTQANYTSHPIGFDNSNGISFPSMEKIANAYDLRFIKCDNYQQAAASIKQALAENDPVICEVVLNPNQPFYPRMVAKKLPDGQIVSCPLEDMFPYLDNNELMENMICKE